MDDYFVWGHITKPHGIKGEVKVYINSDDPRYYSKLKTVFLESKHALIECKILGINILTDNESILKLENITSRTEAEFWCGKSLYLPLKFLPPVSKKGFYYHDIIGYKAFDEKYGELGSVEDVLGSPAQDLMQINFQDKELLIPIVDHFILEINTSEKYIKFNLPEGYIELLTD